MQIEEARKLILSDFPKFNIELIEKLGEGLDNMAFNINNNFVFRFPKQPKNQEALKREVLILQVVRQYSNLPVPKLEFIPENQAYVGYKKLKGKPLLYQKDNFKGWKNFSNQIGKFLSPINNIPSNALEQFEINEEIETLQGWLEDAEKYYNQDKSHIPLRYHQMIENFFKTPVPGSSWVKVFCHNDLGIEHILVDNNQVTGIIDWGDTAIADPAYDLGLIYRDLGKEILKKTLNFYSPIGLVSKDKIFERAIFYGKCTIFEDLYYSIKYSKQEYLDKNLKSLSWMFAIE